MEIKFMRCIKQPPNLNLTFGKIYKIELSDIDSSGVIQLPSGWVIYIPSNINEYFEEVLTNVSFKNTQ